MSERKRPRGFVFSFRRTRVLFSEPAPEARSALCPQGSGCPCEGRVGGSQFRSVKGASKLMSHREELAIQGAWEVKYKWSHLLSCSVLSKDNRVKTEADTSQGSPRTAGGHRRTHAARTVISSLQPPEGGSSAMF